MASKLLELNIYANEKVIDMAPPCVIRGGHPRQLFGLVAIKRRVAPRLTDGLGPKGRAGYHPKIRYNSV